MTEPMAAWCPDGCHWQTHLSGGRAPLHVRTCKLCGLIDWEDLAEQVAGIREGIASDLEAKRDEHADLMARWDAVGLDDQAREASVRSRAFGRAAEIVRECSPTALSKITVPAELLEPAPPDPRQRLDDDMVPGIKNQIFDGVTEARDGVTEAREGSLVEHARRELEILGEFATDPAYAQSIVAAVAAFASYGGHSGGSAMVAREHLAVLLDHRALSPITSQPDEWIDRSEMSGYPLWQNRRDSRAMSHDGGRTYWLVDDDSKTVHTALVDHSHRAGQEGGPKTVEDLV
jgi:hypothetical protein